MKIKFKLSPITMPRSSALIIARMRRGDPIPIEFDPPPPREAGRILPVWATGVINVVPGVHVDADSLEYLGDLSRSLDHAKEDCDADHFLSLIINHIMSHMARAEHGRV